MSHYQHLSIEEREILYLQRGQGKSFRSIAAVLGRSPSTITREYKRGRSAKHSYLPSRAQYRYEKRRRNCGRKRLLADPEAGKLIRSLIEKHWSPEQISNRLKMEDNALQLSWITIYRAIWSGLFDAPRPCNGHRKKADYFVRKLRRKGKKRKHGKGKQGQFTILHHIGERPPECAARSEPGHYEADTVMGTKQGERIVTMVDRCTRFTLAAKVSSADAQTVRDAMLALLSHSAPEPPKSVTPDRGREFAKYQEVTASMPQVTFYFPPPYSPWERGTNENTNGLLREWFPKGKDITPLSDEDIQQAVDMLNLRPRKCLSWRTPFEVAFHQVLHLT